VARINARLPLSLANSGVLPTRGEYPNQTFAGFIEAGSAIATDQRLTMIQGKVISITGTIELREGKPEINVVSTDQIKGLDSPLVE